MPPSRSSYWYLLREPLGISTRQRSATSRRISAGRHEAGRMIKEFREFILRGNVVDLAVAVVIGTAFTALVQSMVKDLFTPLIAAIVGKPDFSALTFTINGSVFTYGVFINAL